MKFCKDCKHVEPLKTMMAMPASLAMKKDEVVEWVTGYRCKRPNRKINLVTGEKENLECRPERASLNQHKDFDFCGPEAKYFEPKEVKDD